MLCGCATPGQFVNTRNLAELSNVPFFPQTEFDCGPAALATVLGASGVDVTPASLIPQVYTAGLEGSLQVELIAATRREGRLPILIRPTTDALFELVASGYPVLILQNLRLRRSPRWHYAVVVGFDAEPSRVILRSGVEPQKRLRAQRFAMSWALAGNWGFVVARPGEIPAGVDADSYMRAVVESERSLGEADVDSAYEAAMRYWPDEPIVLFLAAGNAFNRLRLDEAASLYRRVLTIESDHVAARNNLANVLLDQGCYAAAEAEARRALAGEPSGGAFREAILDTLAKTHAANQEGNHRSAPDSSCS